TKFREAHSERIAVIARCRNEARSGACEAEAKGRQHAMTASGVEGRKVSGVVSDFRALARRSEQGRSLCAWRVVGIRTEFPISAGIPSARCGTFRPVRLAP